MWGEDGACWMAWPCHALSVCFCLSWRWWWWWCSVFAAIPLAMAFACGSASCVTGSTLQWRSSAPTGDRSRRLLASSSSQLVTLDAALLRLRIAAPGHPVRCEFPVQFAVDSACCRALNWRTKRCFCAEKAASSRAQGDGAVGADNIGASRNRRHHICARVIGDRCSELRSFPHCRLL